MTGDGPWLEAYRLAAREAFLRELVGLEITEHPVASGEVYLFGRVGGEVIARHTDRAQLLDAVENVCRGLLKVA